MNLVHLKYALEVAKTRSISKAAENLYMGQPNLSRAIRELEDSLGVSLFDRTSKGITVTADGEIFLGYAAKVMAQVGEMERYYANGKRGARSFSACVPRADYIARAFAAFADSLPADEPIEIYYKETNSLKAIIKVSDEEYDLGIIRYQTMFDRYFRDLFAEKGLHFETIAEFSHVLLISTDSPWAAEETIAPERLREGIEIAHADPYVPSLSPLDLKRAEFSENIDRRIHVFERASQYELLKSLKGAFLWSSPLPEEVCRARGLLQKPCTLPVKTYKDVLIYRKGYRLTEEDSRFITEVCEAKRAYMPH